MFNTCFSKRGKNDRTAAMKAAIERASADYERDFGVTNQAQVQITHQLPPGCGGLQAVDYFLWVVQRFYEFQDTEKRDSECRYVEMIHELTGEIDDVDCLHDGKRGVLWSRKRPLSLTARADATGAKKKPAI